MPGNNSIILTKNVILTFPRAVTKEDFITKIKELASNVIAYLKNNGCDKLGHIKFISTTDGEDYLQLSILDMDKKPKVDGILRKTFEKIKLTLNVIVFGIKKEDINNKISEEITNLEEYFNAS
ncbi:MAG: hypothetical protein FJW69_00880 [Actinobacteria bacterium]|nr:hypothetical protein [Actinomycetota bacterium]MBM3711983.1 hypothetical protein [Actinomycetota bacterium]